VTLARKTRPSLYIRYFSAFRISASESPAIASQPLRQNLLYLLYFSAPTTLELGVMKTSLFHLLNFSWFGKPGLALGCITAALLIPLTSKAGSATWDTNPTSGDWNTATNWTPTTVPNGPDDIATFGQSAITDLTLSSPVEVAEIVFESRSSSFDITVPPAESLLVSGAGITGASMGAASFTCKSGSSGDAVMTFSNSASAGKASFAIEGAGVADPGQLNFTDQSSASKGSFTISGGGQNGAAGAVINFSGTSTAGHGTFVNDGGSNRSLGAIITFDDNSTAAEATITNQGGNGPKPTTGGMLIFNDNATAGTARVTNAYGVSLAGAAQTHFNGNASADHAQFTNQGAPGDSNRNAGAMFFSDDSTAGNAIITNEPGEQTLSPSGSVTFSDNSTAGDATLIANNGMPEAPDAAIIFTDNSSGGNAHIEVNGRGYLDISAVASGTFTVGSLEKSGLAFLGSKNLIVGSNNRTAKFDGVMQDGGAANGTGAALTKIGSGMLTLGGSNLYTGGTTVNAGVLRAANTVKGSATGSGPVQVNDATLGGTGVISGAVTVNGALTPAIGAHAPVTLTIQSALIFNASASYNFSFRGDPGTTGDEVVANGVTINSGATFSFAQQPKGTVRSGTVFTAIENTSAGSIAGTFANLPDGGIVSFSGINFQASYEGGDGNDLTLTVQ
jgi:autotransporter-associated beta strand protein